MIKRQWYWNLPEIRVFFYEWVERCETGKAWALMCKKKKNVLWKVHCCLTPLFCLFGFLIFISSYQVKLGCLDLVWIDCRKFCALFFVCCVPFFFFFFLRTHLFFQKIFGFFFFSKISHFGICLLGFLRIVSPLFCYCFYFPVYCWSNCFLFKVQFHKRRTSTV